MANKNGVYKTEEIKSSGGTSYHRYLRDENGQRILKDGVDPNNLPEAKQKAKDPWKLNRPTRSVAKRLVAPYMIEKMRNARTLRAGYWDKRNSYHIILDEKLANGNDSGWVIMRVCRSHCDDRMVFFNLNDEHWMNFIPEYHKPAYGHESIVWPTHVSKGVSDVNPKKTYKRSVRKNAAQPKEPVAPKKATKKKATKKKAASKKKTA